MRSMSASRAEEEEGADDEVAGEKRLGSHRQRARKEAHQMQHPVT